ncbi:translation initiation factor eIF-2B [Methylophaga sp. OBS4]|uniref:translation initiation factor eIF-2B n=1 Tax=Methylophaga sp. OBS4 TaxID=2991935 RepID=UPI0022584304|nr:hypothetical protein [Methylophaga sp. OBS4]MCX4188597.1 hypothetical protein [Methylophaga sp. OBS4]
MTDTYQTLLANLKNNQQSGATELALTTLQALQQYLQDAAPQTADELTAIAEELAAARPSMIALGNVLHRWLEHSPASTQPEQFKSDYLHNLENIRQQLQQTRDKVALNTCELIKPDMTILTHSRSSQVLALFEQLVKQQTPFAVIITISAPGNEGLLVAQQLNQWQVPTTVITDAELGLFMPEADINISGCDSWLTDHHFVNKSGTLLQALAAQHFGKPFWVLADSFKNSHHNSRQITLESMPADEMQVPNGEFIQARNIYFETISTRLISGRVDEHGVQSGQL